MMNVFKLLSLYSITSDCSRKSALFVLCATIPSHSLSLRLKEFRRHNIEFSCAAESPAEGTPADDIPTKQLASKATTVTPC